MFIIDHDLEGSLWYTGSTIAQTLSGAAGLLGAIMLFALQETSRSIARAAAQLAEHAHPTINQAYIRHVVTRRGFHELARLYGEQLTSAPQGETSVDMLAHHATLTWELEHDSKIRRAFWTALQASGAVIIFSVFVCGLSPQLAGKGGLGQAALVTDVVGAIACLILYGILLRVLFRSQGEVTEAERGRAPRT